MTCNRATMRLYAVTDRTWVGERTLREQVEQISFSGVYASQAGQEVVFVTERAVFRLENGKIVLTEIAPGVELKKDIFDQMEFVPEISPALKTMDEELFKDD